MALASNAAVEIYYERFGDPSDPTLLLISSLGAQCIDYEVEWCEMFVAEGFEVIRFDNRDTGLSSKFEGGARYLLTDMAMDAVAVLDAVDVEEAHVMGASMGGMIAQRLAIDHPDHVLSLTSVMATTGERGFGQSTPEALDLLLAPPPASRTDYVNLHLAALDTFGSRPEWIDRDATAERLGRAFDRSFYPQGVGRQMSAVHADGSRADELRQLEVPTLVMHGSRDKLFDPSGGRRTAELVPGARYIEIDGLGHDHPPAVWRRWVDTWTDFVREHVRAVR